MTDSPLSESLAVLSRFLVGDGSVQETLRRVSELTVEAIPAADLVGLTMLIEGRQRTAVFTDELAPQIDEAQYDSGEGPCMEAFAQQRVFTIESTREEGRWPAFRQAAAEHGIGSTLSLPMVVGERPVGAMNLYAYHEYAFNESDIEIGRVFSAQAAAVLANAHAYWDARDLSARLSEAMKSSAVIEQAKGILIAAQGCDDQAAFDLLVRASQRENVKLRDIAARIVADTIRRGPTNG
jgi:GAF domain-containing protein